MSSEMFGKAVHVRPKDQPDIDNKTGRSNRPTSVDGYMSIHCRSTDRDVPGWRVPIGYYALLLPETTVRRDK